ncbi:MAG: hypothetical protein ACREO3_09585 [Arenimonas sp.]
MKPAAKGLLIGCGSVVLLGVVSVIGIVVWFRAHGDELAAAGKAAQVAGATAGTSLADAQCVDTALANYTRDRGLVGAVQARVWLNGCLGTARATEGFCTNVPSEDQIMASATWRVAACDAHGLGGDSTCPNILAEVQQHCDALQRHGP